MNWPVADMDQDGDVNTTGESIISSAQGSPTDYPFADLDQDGDVDSADLTILQNNTTGSGVEGTVELTYSSLDNPYFFTGRLTDTLHASSLLVSEDPDFRRVQDNRQRTYDPKHGRWLQRDPFEYADTMNLYEYVRSQPTYYVDWMGVQASQPTPRPGVRCVIYLTFDDGPRYGTDDVLDVLDKVKLQGKVMFFVVGAHVERNYSFAKGWRGKKKWTGREIVKLMHDLGNLVAGHSYSHANNKYSVYYKDPEGVLTDFSRNADLLAEILGENYKGRFIARLPGRNTWRVGDIKVTDPTNKKDSAAAADLMAKKGYTIFGWDVEYGQGRHSVADRKALLARIGKLCCAARSATQPSKGKQGSAQLPMKRGKVVVLLHDQNHCASKGGRQPLEDFLGDLKKRKYRFGKLDSY